MIALHAERVEGDPCTVRWVVPPGVVPFVGEVLRAPGECGSMLEQGLLSQVVLEATCVLTTAVDPGAWTELGERVGRTLGDDLADTAWVPAQGPVQPVSLAIVAQEVLAGPVGDYIRSHGGVVEVVDTAGDVLTVALRGVCAHCPASGATLNDRLEAEVRRRYPGLASVRAARPVSRSGVARRTLSLAVRGRG